MTFCANETLLNFRTRGDQNNDIPLTDAYFRSHNDGRATFNHGSLLGTQIELMINKPVTHVKMKLSMVRLDNYRFQDRTYFYPYYSRPDIFSCDFKRYYPRSKKCSTVLFKQFEHPKPMQT